VRQHGRGDLLDILQPHHVTPQEGGTRLGSEDQILHGSRSRAPRNQGLEPGRRGGAIRTRFANEPSRILINVIRHRYAAHQILVLDNVRRTQKMIEFGQRVAGGRAGDLHFLGFRGIVELD
jgi:hypothetical protein